MGHLLLLSMMELRCNVSEEWSSCKSGQVIREPPAKVLQSYEVLLI